MTNIHFKIVVSIKISLNVTFGGSGGIMTTARQELPYPCIFKIKLFKLLGNLLLLIL